MWGGLLGEQATLGSSLPTGEYVCGVQGRLVPTWENVEPWSPSGEIKLGGKSSISIKMRYEVLNELLFDLELDYVFTHLRKSSKN